MSIGSRQKYTKTQVPPFVLESGGGGHNITKIVQGRKVKKMEEKVRRSPFFQNSVNQM